MMIDTRRLGAWSSLLASEQRVADLLEAATPPAEMAAAPVAPARGAMHLVPNYEVTKGGIRREVGAHWQQACVLIAMNAKAAARAERQGVAAVLPFDAGHIGMAAHYRALVEWRSAGGMKCASLEAGRSGSGGSGLFIDTYLEIGAEVEELHRRIGDDVALSPRYAMDRGNGRKVLTARALVDAVVLSGSDLSSVLRQHGWQANGVNRKALRASLRGALDRMQGYREKAPQNTD